MKIPFLTFFARAARPAIANAYEAAQSTETRPQVKTGAPDDAAAKLPQWTHQQLVENCRYAADNFGVAKEVVSSMQIYAIGDGLRAQPRSGSVEWNEQAQKKWRAFERRADVSGKFSLRQLCLFASRALDTDGEIFFIKTFNELGAPCLQVMETHRLSYKTDSNAGIVDGIQWDATGAPKTYFFKSSDGETLAIDAGKVIRVANIQRASETRCAPALQHAICHLKDAFTLLEMEKKNAAAQANFAIQLTTPRPETAEQEIDAFGAVYSQAPETTTPRVSEISKLDGGKMLKVPEGMKLDILESKRPSQAFIGFYEALQRDSTLGVSSYEIAVDASKIGGASVRLQTAKMERRVSARQQDIIEQFLVPAWLFVIGNAIKNNELPVQPGWNEVEFSTPRRLTVDAGRESAALINEVRTGTRPIEDLFDAMGYGDWEEETRRRAQLIKKTKDIAEEFGVEPTSLAPLLFSNTSTAKQ